MTYPLKRRPFSNNHSGNFWGTEHWGKMRSAQTNWIPRRSNWWYCENFVRMVT